MSKVAPPLGLHRDAPLARMTGNIVLCIYSSKTMFSKHNSFRTMFDEYVQMILARWAPAMKGSRWMQSDSAAADEVRLLLATSEPLTLDSDALPPIYVSRRLGEGRFGDVLLGEMPSGDQVAIKVALRPTSELSREAAVLSALRRRACTA